MKNTMHKMKRILAALLAAACLPVVGLTASAEGMTYYWGTATWDAFEGMEPINSYGIFWDYPYVYANENAGYGQITLMEPLDDRIEMVVRDDADAGAAFENALAVLKLYYPGLEQKKDTYAEIKSGSSVMASLYMDNGKLTFYCHEKPKEAAQLEQDLLLGLAKKQCISGFYGFGGTAFYSIGYIQNEVLTGYPDMGYTLETDTDGSRHWKSKSILDVDAVQDYLDAHHAGLSFVSYQTEKSTASVGENGDTEQLEYHLYRVEGAENMTFQEKAELACELQANLGLELRISFPASELPPLLGHNALENKGDVTLDLELDIMDVIAANKAILGSYSLCDTARKNADISGDGTPDETDSLAILNEVVGITEGFVEP